MQLSELTEELPVMRRTTYFGVVELNAAMPLLMTVTVLVGIVAFFMIALGLFLTLKGRRGITQMRVLGAEVKAQSVGIASLACALVLLLFVLAPTIQAVVDLAKIQSPAAETKTP
jgi:hypothetical protein